MANNIDGNRITPPNRYAAGQPISYWLVPAAADRLRLQQQIDALAGELDAPGFEPHITLHSSVLADAEDPNELLKRIAGRLAPIRLDCGPTGHSGMLFKTLFVQFSYQSLAPLSTAIRDRSRQFSSYQFDPHLSLLYRSIPRATREALADKLDMRGRKVRFSSLAAVIPGPGETDFQNVGAWQVCARQRLMGESKEAPPGEIPPTEDAQPQTQPNPGQD